MAHKRSQPTRPLPITSADPAPVTAAQLPARPSPTTQGRSPLFARPSPTEPARPIARPSSPLVRPAASTMRPGRPTQRPAPATQRPQRPTQRPPSGTTLRPPAATMRPSEVLPALGAAVRATRPQVDHPTPSVLREIIHPPVLHPPADRPRRARGTPRDAVAPGEQIRTLIFAPEATRAAWVEGELSRAPISISIQVGRRVRTVVSALVRDPEPRPHVLIVDFDAVTPAELLELHAIRHEGWGGRLIGLGNVPDDLRASLEVDHVFVELVRDALLDCIAGTGYGSATVPIPIEMLATLTNARSRE